MRGKKTSKKKIQDTYSVQYRQPQQYDTLAKDTEMQGTKSPYATTQVI